jgi:uncharacterized protein YkwD
MVDMHTAPRRRAVARPHAVSKKRFTVTLIAAFAVALMAFVPAAGAQARCRGAHTRIRSASRRRLQRAVVCLINQQRRAHGLHGLRDSSRLNRSAQGWTNTMVTRRDFTHGTDFSARISAVGFDWSNVGENIATGYKTPAAVVRAWMRSTGHCQNILSPIYREVGTGLRNLPISGYSSHAGTWTQDFGLLMSQHAPSANYGPADGCPYS